MNLELSKKEADHKESGKNTTCGMDFGSVKLISWTDQGDTVALVYRVEPFKAREGMFTNRMTMVVSKKQFLDIAGAVIVNDSASSHKVA